MKTARISNRIVSEPRGPAYEALIRYCAAEGALCTLADLFPRSKAGRQASAHFLSLAEPYLDTMLMAERWPLGDPETGDPSQPTQLWRFVMNDAFAELLLDGPVGLYGWKSPKFPEDFAVYRKDGSVLLGTVVHEHLGWMNLSSEDASDVRLGLVEFEVMHR